MASNTNNMYVLNKSPNCICLVLSFFSSDLRVSVKDSLVCLCRGRSRDVVSSFSKKSPVVSGTAARAETGSPLFISAAT